MARQFNQFQAKTTTSGENYSNGARKKKKVLVQKNVGSTMNGDIKTSGNGRTDDDNTN